MTPVKAMIRQNNNDTIRQTRTELLSPKSSVEEGELDSMEKSKQILMPLLLADNDPWIKRQKVELRKNYKAIYEKSNRESFQ